MMCSSSFLFQSTPSPRRETSSSFSLTCLSKFQSTPSPRRETFRVNVVVKQLYISIHSLPKEGDEIKRRPTYQQRHFNPLPPQGGRPDQRRCGVIGLEISIHSLPKEGDPQIQPKHGLQLYFNPLPPQGGRPPSTGKHRSP